ncbi:MAG: NAD(P)H-dependent oxidoreductase subunit E [Actinobacteria bacterium]|nr:NAD(P)H-dependent oxidoreductase subunit E [Actinomycetota bacterium]MCG2817680.1 NAD(P)H-dependent oxidoreductase subunit E [Actinomycetes bacterium]MBU4178818.1 NAD(P)H-dependent oxidoreductase subunit E [Actinomycetota bacterium]MBU4219307.1 NAD(P)H-dependent oxidoreductase subunit E [Actinomycetota bacterium]MBU4359591.1 NAD(P)H-dependent oxidoreductase subunit E [Actinomycetota bacterium]
MAGKAGKVTDEEKQRIALDRVLKKYSKQKGALIPVLQEAQEGLGYLSEETLGYIARNTGRTLAQVYGVVTFYTQFRLEPIGRHLVRICHGTACHVGGAEDIDAAVCGHLDLDQEGGTTPDMEFTVEKVVCVGACSLAPIILVDNVAHGRLDSEKARKVIREYQKRKQGARGS